MGWKGGSDARSLPLEKPLEKDSASRAVPSRRFLEGDLTHRHRSRNRAGRTLALAGGCRKGLVRRALGPRVGRQPEMECLQELEPVEVVRRLEADRVLERGRDRGAVRRSTPARAQRPERGASSRAWRAVRARGPRRGGRRRRSVRKGRAGRARRRRARRSTRAATESLGQVTTVIRPYRPPARFSPARRTLPSCVGRSSPAGGKERSRRLDAATIASACCGDGSVPPTSFVACSSVRRRLLASHNPGAASSRPRRDPPQ